MEDRVGKTRTLRADSLKRYYWHGYEEYGNDQGDGRSRNFAGDKISGKILERPEKTLLHDHVLHELYGSDLARKTQMNAGETPARPGLMAASQRGIILPRLLACICRYLEFANLASCLANKKRHLLTWLNRLMRR